MGALVFPTLDAYHVKRHRGGTLGALWLVVAGLATACMPPSWGAHALLHPPRRVPTGEPPTPVEHVTFQGEDVALVGWWFHAPQPVRGTVVYLHGVGDNRASSVGLAAHFVAAGLDVVAYDSRAHGESGGDACTYGYYEKRDLSRVLDRLTAPVVLFGASLGAAVALQTAARDSRVDAVIAVAAFSDLRTVATERAPFFASHGNIAEALRQAEQAGHFPVDGVSPVRSAAVITAPVLIIHGDHDAETPPAHSERIAAALRGPKRFILVPSRGHRDALTPAVWHEIDQWLSSVLESAAARYSRMPTRPR